MEASIDENSGAAGEATAMDISIEKPAHTDDEFFEDAAHPQEADTAEPTDENNENRFGGATRGSFR